ncbi:MAG: 4Fe-4S dicluster domain-containing protein [Sutterellaceae bacterium]|nr:4Fe-4S dicluster domain-containing protein [Sutterellaceae bacterium]MDD7442759.1 4Fe-4S dicluster domain-containing protein [Sutterellaceae bacterium]MDY2867548.1 4Fe-4S dicluster domain-containing protein [Mesosutterella sp.]
MIDRRTLLKLVAGGAAFTLVPSGELLAKTSGKRYAMVFDVRRCTGCLSCTVNCAMEHGIEDGRMRTVVGQVAVKGRSSEAVISMPRQCNHCDNPPCVKACPVKATWKRAEDGIVVIDYDKCIHCMNCVPACPYGARSADPDKKTPPEKCNFCIGRLEAGLLPACVESCIGHARIFGDLNDPKSEISRVVRENRVYALLTKEGTKPNIFYVGLPESIDDRAMLSLDSRDWQR